MSSPLAPLDAPIQAAYAPAAATDSSAAPIPPERTPRHTAHARRAGLFVPLLAHADANVQFFGAHTAAAKIARGDHAFLPLEHQLGLRDAPVGLAGVPRERVVRRKLSGTLAALARLVPGRPSGWEGWLGAAAEDVGAANLLPEPNSKIQLTESLPAAAPLVLQSIESVLADSTSTTQDPDALRCLTAWLPSGLLPTPDVAPLVPPLIALLSASPTPSSLSTLQSSLISPQGHGASGVNEAHVTATSAALQDLLARAPAAWGPAIPLEPLFVWAAAMLPLCVKFQLALVELLCMHARVAERLERFTVYRRDVWNMYAG
ncbi:hypothetical protein DFH09DRAFT_1473919 [Mycena vulgaris]|nr:hypothetical protein DFH09DRAFT_1473919 [Mycena vulgaris]